MAVRLDCGPSRHAGLSEQMLRALAGTVSLESIEELAICVDASEQSVSIIGELLPRLAVLRLDNSVLSTCRDLGTALSSLVVLRAERCGLTGLDGVAALPALRELYLARNEVSDVAPLLLHDSLEVLDLTANGISEEEALMQLGTCSRLHTLSLDDNPLATLPDFRALAAGYIPQLATLDGRPLAGQQPAATPPMDAAVPLARATGCSFGASAAVPHRPSAAPPSVPPRHPSLGRGDGKLLAPATSSASAAASAAARAFESSVRGSSLSGAGASDGDGDRVLSAGSSRSAAASDDATRLPLSVLPVVSAGSSRPGGGAGPWPLSGSATSFDSDGASTTSAGDRAAGDGGIGVPARAGSAPLASSGTRGTLSAPSAHAGHLQPHQAAAAGPGASPTRAIHSAPFLRPSSAARPASAQRRAGAGPDASLSDKTATAQETSSSLTHGDNSRAVFVGSAVQALRQRRLSRALSGDADGKDDLDPFSTTWPGAASAGGGGGGTPSSPQSSFRPESSAGFGSFSGGGHAGDGAAAACALSGVAASPSAWRRPGSAGRSGRWSSTAGADDRCGTGGGKDGSGGSSLADDSWLPAAAAEQSILDVLDEGRRQEQRGGARRTEPILLSALSPPPPAPPPRTVAAAGPALSMPDSELVALLQKRPKDVPQLHSRESFRRFFAGMPRERMLALLRRAFAASAPLAATDAGCGADAESAEARALRRLELLDGVLA